jgi:hypothetical protein
MRTLRKREKGTENIFSTLWWCEMQYTFLGIYTSHFEFLILGWASEM